MSSGGSPSSGGTRLRRLCRSISARQSRHTALRSEKAAFSFFRPHCRHVFRVAITSDEACCQVWRHEGEDWRLRVGPEGAGLKKEADPLTANKMSAAAGAVS